MSSRNEKNPFLNQSHAAVAALIVLALIWGYNWVVMKVALKDCGPFTFAAMRTTFGALVIFPLMSLKGKPVLPKSVPKVFLLGLLQTTAFIGFTFWALVGGGVGKTAVLVYTMPFWLLIMARFYLGEFIRGVQWLAVLVSCAGLFLIFEPWHGRGGLFSEMLAILAGISWAASVIAAKRIRRQETMPLLSLTAWQMLFGAVPLIIIALLAHEGPVNWSPSFIAALLYNIVPGNAVAWFLWMFIVEKLPAGAAGMGSLAIPLVGVLAAWIQIGEKPGLYEGAGMLLIGAALLILSLNALYTRQ
ncbi:MAG TPA: EamA family transporter [Geobacteraceae bacterium]|nr:EamA family transporter [Geobacteraceae bacterium]